MLYFGAKELWTDLEGRESYPVKELKDFLGRLSDDSGDGITFDFSGIEQVTDLALYALSSSLETKAASKVKKIVLTGCQYVTDYGVSQLSLAFSNLEEVILDGCAAVTEKSVFHLKRRCPHLTHLSVISTSVGDIPLPIGDTKIYLDGCPIFTGIDLQEASPLVEQKVVILVQPTLTLSVLDLLKDGVFKETTGDRCLHYCPKVTVGGATANVFEFHTDSTYDYLPFLSSGATYIITVELTTAEECAKGLLEAYRNIKTRTCHSCFVVLILHKEDVRGAKSVQKTMLNSLHAAENAFKKHVSEPMHSNGDFYRQLLQARNQDILSAEQQELTKLSFFGFDKKTSCISKLGSHSNAVGDDSGTSKSGAVESKDGLQNELQACFEHLSETCPWESKQVSAEVKQFYDQLPQEKILTMAGLISKSGGKTDDGGPFRKLLSRLDRMGRLVYCPNVYHETVILDVQWLMDVLMIPHNMEEYQNGDHTTALPANVPLFEEAKFKTLYASCCTDVEYSAMKNLLKVLRLIFNVPCWPIGGGQKENLIAFAADLPPSPSIRHAAPDLNIWEEFWPDKKLPTDAEVNYRYQVHTGVPSSAISWISSKLLPRHDVLFLWKHGIIFRDGAVEVLLIEEDVPVPSINLQARCTRFESGKGKIDLILAEYLWNVMNDICLLVESVLHSFIHCSYAVVVPCRGECPNNGAFHIINPDHLKPDPNHIVTCQKCGGEIDKSVVSFVNGRSRCLPLHDWRNEKTGYRCSTCRVNEGRAMKRWIMECQLHPNFASRCFKMFCDGDKVGSSMSGNILASRGSRPCYVISEHPLSEADFSQLDLCIIDPAGIEFLLVQEPIKYLTKDAEDRVKMTHCAISLETGQVLGVEEMVEKRPFKKGDQMRVSVSRQKQDTDDTSMFVCDVFKNGIPMHQFTLPEKSHVVIRCDGKDEAEKTKLILSSPRCPVVTSAHFQVGTCLLHKVDGSTTWYGGIIEKINDGYLYVVRTTADGLAAQSTRFLPDSEELAPLCHFPADADVVLSQGQVTSEDMIFSFLKQYFVTPAPMGLFPAFTNMPNYKPLQLHSIRAKSCVTSVYSPSMLYQSFKISGKPAVLKRQPLGFVVLPVNIKEHHLYHTGRQLTQDWANQGIGFMCKGEMLAHSTMRIGHLQDGKVAPLVSDQLQLFSLDEKSKLWKFLINSVYFLLQSYAQLTTQPPIVSSWTHLLPDISQDLSHDHISEGLSKLTRWYQHTLVLFCALSSPLKNFYPPYFNGMEFADIIRKVTMVMKDELNPNNVFGFCDTHHYLLRAFRVNKDPEDPGAMPKLAVDLTKLGLNSSCIRELKIEEFPTDSIPSVVLECMQKFPNLIRVQLSKCGLTSVHGIETCESLKTFEADSNELEHLHHGFEKLKHTLELLQAESALHM
ncbi:uncharacterized protein LOC135485964 [Lineus longissimus]|uniref:uncharacterized protein LOC135485964 n=1 Tax=Lineus longissimus TaxID=88925 RepID=UPI00315CAFA1